MLTHVIPDAVPNQWHVNTASRYFCTGFQDLHGRRRCGVDIHRCSRVCVRPLQPDCVLQRLRSASLEPHPVERSTSLEVASSSSRAVRHPPRCETFHDSNLESRSTLQPRVSTRVACALCVRRGAETHGIRTFETRATTLAAWSSSGLRACLSIRPSFHAPVSSAQFLAPQQFCLPRRFILIDRSLCTLSGRFVSGAKLAD